MGEHLELISDGEGLAVVGPKQDVERFLARHQPPSRSLVLSKVSAIAEMGSSIVDTLGTAASESGRWVKLTAESADKVKQFGLQPTDTPGVRHAMIGQPGKIQEWIQVEDPGSIVSLAGNPAVLSGAAGVMAQLAMQQTMAEITDYLQRIDEKLDDVLRAQTNQVLAKMDAVGLAVREAETVRDTVGHVSDVTWSKIQNSSAAVLETQAYALRQLSDLASKLEEKAGVDQLVKVARQAENEVQQWLTVLARCFQLHDAIAVIELDRVLEIAPDELDRHRLGLLAAREERLELMSTHTTLLLERMEAAAATANSKVFFNPIQSPAIVNARNEVSIELHEFRELLEIESHQQSAEARRWREAAGEKLEQARGAGDAGVGALKKAGSGTRGVLAAASGKAAGRARGLTSSGVTSVRRLGAGAAERTRGLKERRNVEESDEPTGETGE